MLRPPVRSVLNRIRCPDARPPCEKTPVTFHSSVGRFGSAGSPEGVSHPLLVFRDHSAVSMRLGAPTVRPNLKGAVLEVKRKFWLS